MKLSTRARLTITLVAIVAFSITSFIVQRGYSYTVAKTTVELSAVPKKIDNWTAEEAELTDAEFGVLNASDVASLKFSDAIGRSAFLHVATWTDRDEVAETCPHHPGVCYSGNGWYPIKTRREEIEIEGIGLVPIEMSLMDRNGERLVVAFSYAMGEYRFATDSQARLVQTKLWGYRTWPPVTKYMIQVASDDLDDSLSIVKQLLGEVMRWHHQHDTTQRAIDASA